MWENAVQNLEPSTVQEKGIQLFEDIGGLKNESTWLGKDAKKRGGGKGSK